MLFTIKNKSDVNLKGQRIQCFLRENINRAKTRQVRVNSKHVRAYVLQNLIPGRGPCYPEACSLTSGKHRKDDWVWKSKWHKCNKTYILKKATKQSIIKNKRTTNQIVTIQINKQGRRSHVTLVALCLWLCLWPGSRRELPSRVFRTSSNVTICYHDRRD